MSLVVKGDTIKEIAVTGNRVLQVRTKGDRVFTNYDFTFRSSFPGSVVSGTVTLTIMGSSQKTIVVWGIGGNADIFKSQTTPSSFVKDFTSGADNNGTLVSNSYYDNYVFFEDLEKVTGISITSSNSNLYSAISLGFLNKMPNLKQVNLSNDRVSNFATLFTHPTLERITLSLDPSGGAAINLRNAIATAPALKWLTTNGYNTNLTAIVDVLPASVKYYRWSTFPNLAIDLKDYFNGNRVGLHASYEGKLSYSGGAIFPSVLSEDSGQEIPYILYQNSQVSRKLTSDEFSQFIIDMANQVTSVTLANKRIYVSGTTPNTSYTDSSQPTYTTYTAARNRLVALGITITTS